MKQKGKVGKFTVSADFKRGKNTPMCHLKFHNSTLQLCILNLGF